MGVQSVLGGAVAWHSEIDPDASRILVHHWPDVPNLGDITKVDWSKVPSVDVLTLGFPCQDLSTAGSRHGMTPTNRSGLWSHAAYAISQLRPALVVIENVRGMLTSRGAEPTEELLAAWDERDRVARIIALIERKHRKAVREGKDFYVQQHATDRLRFMGRHRRAVAAVRRADARIVRAIGTVLGDLARLGYDAQWHGLRAAEVGAPHGRLRIFIVATDARLSAGSERYDAYLLGRREGDAQQARLGADPTADTRGEHGQQRRVAAPGQTTSGRPLREPARRRGTSAPNTEFGGRDGRAPDPLRCALGGIATARCGPVSRAAIFAGRWCACEAVADPPGDPGRLLNRDSRAASADASGNRRGEGWPESARLVGGSDAAVRGDAVVADASGIKWGEYEPAIRRWEIALGRVAPAPTEAGSKGAQRLSPRFVEWMMGLPEGHVTDPAIGISRNAQLKALGNGVVPQQAAAAVSFLLTASERAA